MAYNKANAKQSLRDKLVNEFQWPDFDDAELLRFCDVMADWIDEQKATFELNSATLDDNAVSGTVDGSGTPISGQVDVDTVSGGII